ncbi:MAG: hypothetical protein WC620_03555 [Methanoregula sp.]
MKKSSIMMLIASAILIAGILVAGCTQSTDSTTTQTAGSTGQTAGQPVRRAAGSSA